MTVTAGPTVSGVYDYWLGGGQHLRADRVLARAIEAEFPSVPGHVRAAQDFHQEAARRAAGEGITRFIRTGPVTALPGRNVRDAVRRTAPSARIVYACSDPAGIDMTQALLSGERLTAVIPVGPGGTLKEEAVRAMLAPRRPVCVISGLKAHFVPPGLVAARMKDLAGPLPPGSVLAMTLAVPGETPEARKLVGMFTPSPVYSHTTADIEGWLEEAGLDIVPPGVTDTGPRGPALADGEPGAGTPGFIAGVLARVR